MASANQAKKNIWMVLKLTKISNKSLIHIIQGIIDAIRTQSIFNH